MENETLNKESVNCVGYRDSFDAEIKEFYAHVFNSRWEKTFKIFKWLNRYKYYPNHNSPYLLIRNDKIVAQVGTIPEDVSINNAKYKLAFTYDFIADKEIRGRALTRGVYRHTMQQADVLVAYTNENSSKLSKFFGFDELYNSYFMAFNTNAVFGHRYIPEIILYPLRKLICGIKYNYQKYKCRDIPKNIEKVSASNIISFYNTGASQKNEVTFIRDEDYFKWRVFDSPNFNEYRVFKCADNDKTQLLIRLTPAKVIMVLIASNKGSVEDMQKCIASLCVWAIKNRYLSVYYYTNNPELANSLIKAFNVKRYNNPRFLFYSRHKELAEELKRSNWNIEIINSDFEFIL